MSIILASGSPRRRELLATLCVPFKVRTFGAEEPQPLRERTVEENLREIVAAKAAPATAAFPDDMVIAADTVVVLDGEYFGKPSDPSDAVRMLKTLAAQTHFVYTGVMICEKGDTEFFVERTAVTFRELSDEEISQYVAGAEPMDKAGAYGIQGEGARFVDRIDGDFYNVMGLPLERLKQRICKP